VLKVEKYAAYCCLQSEACVVRKVHSTPDRVSRYLLNGTRTTGPQDPAV